MHLGDHTKGMESLVPPHCTITTRWHNYHSRGCTDALMRLLEDVANLFAGKMFAIIGVIGKEV